MNSLEFINKEIENIKELLELDDVLCLKTDEDYKFWYDRLQTLQQIKTELEAWEVVKDKINITEYYDNEQDYEEDINSHNALCLNSNLKIQNSNNEEDWFIPLDNEDCKKLKKALEVEDE